MPTTFNVRLIATAIVAVLVFGTGWTVRGVLAERDMADYQLRLQAQAADQRDLKTRVEAAQAQTTKESSQRVDQKEADRQVEVRYVDREVVKYREVYRDRACPLPDQWVHLVNCSFGVGNDCAMSGATAAGR